MNEDLLEKSIILATSFHMKQKDKGGNNLILHPLRVMLEDTKCTKKYLKQYPQEIIDALDAITRREDETYFEYINRVKENKIARQVKIYDLEDNLSENRINNINTSLIKRYRKAMVILK